jgi:hypothetical protein
MLRRSTHTRATTAQKEHMRKIREHILQSIPQQPNGINTERVVRYLKRHKLRIAPWLLLSCVQVPELLALLRSLNYISPNLERLLPSPYCPEYFEWPLDITFVTRGNHYEVMFGPQFTEIQLVHGLVHGAGWSDKYLATSLMPVRCGLMLEEGENSGGAFFSEALAQLYAVSYAETELELKYGIGNAYPLPEPVYGLPPRHLIGPASFMSGSIAAHGIELLIAAEPRIRRVMDACNAGAPLARLKRAVDRTGGKGLFEYLFRLEYSTDEFLRGREAIKQALA